MTLYVIKLIDGSTQAYDSDKDEVVTFMSHQFVVRFERSGTRVRRVIPAESVLYVEEISEVQDLTPTLPEDKQADFGQLVK